MWLWGVALRTCHWNIATESCTWFRLLEGGSSAVQNYAFIQAWWIFHSTKKLAIKDVISLASPKMLINLDVKWDIWFLIFHHNIILGNLNSSLFLWLDCPVIVLQGKWNRIYSRWLPTNSSASVLLCLFMIRRSIVWSTTSAWWRLSLVVIYWLTDMTPSR